MSPISNDKDFKISVAFSYTQKLSLMAGSISALYMFPTQAEAAIIYQNTPLSSINVSDSNGTAVFWDVDGDSSNDFRLLNYKYTSTGGSIATYLRLNSNSLNGQGMVQNTGDGFDVVKKLALNFAVGPTLAANYQFSPSGQSDRTAIYATTGGSVVGNGFLNGGFTGGGNEYFGFSFNSGVNTLYGWANIDIDATNGSVTITEWAYNDTPDGEICVGQTVDNDPNCDPSPSVPESNSSLALLAMGAAGVYRWRKRKQQQFSDDQGQ